MLHLPLPAFSPDHLHPIFENFTAALIPASLGSDLLGRVLRRASLHAAAWWMLVYAAAISPLTALSGLWWKQREAGNLPAKLVQEHQWLGIALVVLFIALAVWRYRIYRKDVPPGVLYFAMGVVLLGALVVQGALGGEMLMG